MYAISDKTMRFALFFELLNRLGREGSRKPLPQEGIKLGQSLGMSHEDLYLAEFLYSAHCAIDYSQDYEKALVALEQAEQLAPDFGHINYLQGFCYAQLGKDRQAKEALERCLAKNRKHPEAGLLLRTLNPQTQAPKEELRENIVVYRAKLFLQFFLVGLLSSAFDALASGDYALSPVFTILHHASSFVLLYIFWKLFRP